MKSSHDDSQLHPRSMSQASTVVSGQQTSPLGQVCSSQEFSTVHTSLMAASLAHVSKSIPSQGSTVAMQNPSVSEAPSHAQSVISLQVGPFRGAHGSSLILHFDLKVQPSFRSQFFAVFDFPSRQHLSLGSQTASALLHVSRTEQIESPSAFLILLHAPRDLLPAWHGSSFK